MSQDESKKQSQARERLRSRKEEKKEALNYLRESLGQMKGSYKQIKWAEDIVNKKLPKIKKAKEEIEKIASNPNTLSNAQKAHLKTLYNHTKELIDIFNNQDASKIIDAKDHPWIDDVLGDLKNDFGIIID